MGLPERFFRFGQNKISWKESLKRLGWFMLVPAYPRPGGWFGRRPGRTMRLKSRRRYGRMRLAHWRRAAQSLPCWGLGAVARWPWGKG